MSIQSQIESKVRDIEQKPEASEEKKKEPEEKAEHSDDPDIKNKELNELKEKKQIKKLSEYQQDILNSKIGLDNGDYKHHKFTSDQEMLKFEYWSTRYKDVRTWCWYVNISNCFYQYAAITNPRSEMHLKINKAYNVITLFCFVLLISSHCFQRNMGLTIQTCCMILAFRAVFKMYDFEQVKDTYDGTDEWYEIITMQCICTFIFIGYLFKCFQSSVIGNALAYILIFILAIGINIGLLGVSQFSFDFITIFKILFNTFQFWYHMRCDQRCNKQLDLYIVDKVEQKQELNTIIQNLQESLIIFSENKMELVNNQFLNQFRHLIISHQDQTASQTNTSVERDSHREKWKAVYDCVSKKCKSIDEQDIEKKRQEREILQTSIMEAQYFSIYKELEKSQALEQTSEYEDKKMSLDEILKMDLERLDSTIFEIKSLEEDQKQYVQLKVNTYEKDEQVKKIIQINDITHHILFIEQKAKTQFTQMINATVSHELRNPLNSIIAKNLEKEKLYEEMMLHLDLIDVRSRESHSFKKCNELVVQLKKGQQIQQNAAQFMRFMIQDMLDLAQIKSGKFRKNISEFNIKKSVQKVMDIQSQQAADKKLALTCEFIGFHDDDDETSGNVGGLRSPIIKCDENRVMQVLLGLQSNALKFTEVGSVHIRVEIIDEYLRVSVVDTGIGIPKEHQDKLFKLFGFIQDDKQLNINGIGLGLMISRQIVEKFNGDIIFESAKNKGSTFQFTFKLNNKDEIEQSKLELQDSRNNYLDQSSFVYKWQPSINNHMIVNDVKYSFNEKFNGLHRYSNLKKILIVDDQSFNVDAAIAILKYAIKLKDFQELCDFAYQGKEALEMVIKNVESNQKIFTNYELILMDCNMPIMDGYQATQKIRQYLFDLGINQPIIIAATGHTEEVYVNRAINSGMNQVLSKPLQISVLNQIINILDFPIENDEYKNPIRQLSRKVTNVGLEIHDTMNQEKLDQLLTDSYAFNLAMREHRESKYHEQKKQTLTFHDIVNEFRMMESRHIGDNVYEESQIIEQYEEEKEEIAAGNININISEHHSEIEEENEPGGAQRLQDDGQVSPENPYVPSDIENSNSNQQFLAALSFTRDANIQKSNPQLPIQALGVIPSRHIDIQAIQDASGSGSMTERESFYQD